MNSKQPMGHQFARMENPAHADPEKMKSDPWEKAQ